MCAIVCQGFLCYFRGILRFYQGLLCFCEGFLTLFHFKYVSCDTSTAHGDEAIPEFPASDFLSARLTRVALVIQIQNGSPARLISAPHNCSRFVVVQPSKQQTDSAAATIDDDEEVVER